MSTAQANAFQTTIGTGGTLSGIIDLEGWDTQGLIVVATGSTLVVSTLGFQVSADGSNFYTLQDVVSGVLASLGIGHSTSNFAVAADDLAVLKPYRYVRFTESVAQPNGVTLIMPVKKA